MSIFIDTVDAADQAPQSFAKGNPTGFMANVRAGFDETMATGLTVSRDRRRAQAYEAIIDALDDGRTPRLANPYKGAAWGVGGRKGARYASFLDEIRYGDFTGTSTQDQVARIWTEVGRRRRANPQSLAGVPHSAEALQQQIDLEDQLTLERSADVRERATLAGDLGFFTGAAGASFRDPVNVLALPFGAGASRTVLAAAIKGAAINAAVEAGSQPAIAQNYAELGIEYGLDDALFSIGAAAAFGGAIDGGAKALAKPARAAYDWAARSTPELLQAFRERVGIPRTREEADAIAVLEAQQDVDATSPFVDTPDAAAEHRDRLQAALDALEAGQSVSLPPARARLADDAGAPGSDAIERALTTSFPTERIDAAAVRTDARRFQYKADGDQEGVTQRLQGVDRFSPMLAGRIVVWEDAAGERFVVNGHQRTGLARRTKRGDPAADTSIDAVVLREAAGVTPDDARIIGAMINIAEGSGTVIDGAKVLRQRPDLAAMLPRTGGFMRDTIGLARLSDRAFGMVANGVVDPELGAAVGRVARDAPELHESLVALMKRLDPKAAQAEAIIRDALASGYVKEEQLGLFGPDMRTETLYLDRARVLEQATSKLRAELRTSRTVNANADALEEIGNSIDVEANAAAADVSARLLDVLERTVHAKGPISSALTDAARAARKARNWQRAADDFIQRLRDEPDLVDAALADAPPPAPEPLAAPLLELEAGQALAAPQLDAFADPASPAARDQVDLLQHDLRPQEPAGGPPARDGVSGRPEVAPGATQGSTGFDPTPGRILDRRAVAGGQLGKSLDELVDMADRNQHDLNAAVRFIATVRGIDGIEARPKTADSIAKKMATGVYAEPGELVDLARASFVIDRPEQADEIVADLLGEYAAHDKGWQLHESSGYLDRKIIVAFENGGAAEIQILPRGVYEFKRAGGHKLYKVSEDFDLPAEERAAASAQMLAGYAEAAKGFETAARSVEKSASVNSAMNASSDISTPSRLALIASGEANLPDPSLPAGIGSRQPSLVQTTARETLPSSQNTTGLSSSSQNFKSMGDPSGADISPNNPLDNADPRAGADDAFALEDVAADGELAPQLRTADEILTELDADDAAIAAAKDCLL